MQDTNALSLVAEKAAAINTIIVSVIGFLGIVVTTIGTVLLAKININSKGSKDASEKSVSVSLENGKKVDGLQVTTLQIHNMVNRPFGVALETAAVAMETIAEMTKREDHKQAASTARKVSDEHHSAMQAFEVSQKIKAALREAAPQVPVSESSLEKIAEVKADVRIELSHTDIKKPEDPADSGSSI